MVLKAIQEINWLRVAVIGLMFWIIYTGGCHNRPDDIEEQIVAECQRQLKGTQGYAYCACGNRKECR